MEASAGFDTYRQGGGSKRTGSRQQAKTTRPPREREKKLPSSTFWDWTNVFGFDDERRQMRQTQASGGRSTSYGRRARSWFQRSFHPTFSLLHLPKDPPTINGSRRKAKNARDTSTNDCAAKSTNSTKISICPVCPKLEELKRNWKEQNGYLTTNMAVAGARKQRRMKEWQRAGNKTHATN